MIKDLRMSPVIFDPIAHTYATPDGLVLSGVTSVLHRNMFKDKYSGIPKSVLDKAANRGSLIHAALQMQNEFGTVSELREVVNWTKIKKEHGIKPLANEYLVSDEVAYATMVDMVDEDLNLYDYKTTSKLDEEYLSWQLSINAYLFEMQNPTLKAGKLFAVWLRWDIAELKEVERKDDALIRDLLLCDNAGLPFECNLPQREEPKEITMLLDLEELVIHAEDNLKQLKENRDTLRSSLLQAMTDSGQKSIETERLKISVSKSSQRTTIDAKKLQTDYPLVYDEVKKTTQTKPSLRVTIK